MRVDLPPGLVRCPECGRHVPPIYIINSRCEDCDAIAALDRRKSRHTDWRIGRRERVREAAVVKLRTVLTKREAEDLAADHFGHEKQYAIADRRKVTDRTVRANVARALKKVEKAGLRLPWKAKRAEMKVQRFDPQTSIVDFLPVKNGVFLVTPGVKGKKLGSKYASFRGKS